MLGKSLDLNELCIRHPESTFFFRLQSHEGEEFGVRPGDILVVDRCQPLAAGKLFVAIRDGELCLKKYGSRIQSGIQELQVWGVVTYVISPR